MSNYTGSVKGKKLTGEMMGVVDPRINAIDVISKVLEAPDYLSIIVRNAIVTIDRYGDIYVGAAVSAGLEVNCMAVVIGRLQMAWSDDPKEQQDILIQFLNGISGELHSGLGIGAGQAISKDSNGNKMIADEGIFVNGIAVGVSGSDSVKIITNKNPEGRGMFNKGLLGAIEVIKNLDIDDIKNALVEAEKFSSDVIDGIITGLKDMMKNVKFLLGKQISLNPFVFGYTVSKNLKLDLSTKIKIDSASSLLIEKDCIIDISKGGSLMMKKANLNVSNKCTINNLGGAIEICNAILENEGVINNGKGTIVVGYDDSTQYTLETNSTKDVSFEVLSEETTQDKPNVLLTNKGAINNNGGIVNIIYGKIVNDTNGTLSVQSGGNINVDSGTINNYGKLIVDTEGAVSAGSGSIKNYGNITVKDSGLIMTEKGAIDNHGTLITNTSGVVSVDSGSINNYGSLTAKNNGLIVAGNGTIDNHGNVISADEGTINTVDKVLKFKENESVAANKGDRIEPDDKGGFVIYHS